MSLTGDARARPPRVSLTNLRSGETVEMPFTPEELVETITVNWAKKAVLGMSHEILQYGHTSNYSLDGLDFFHRATTEDEAKAIHEGRKFLLSLAYAPEGANGLRDGSPPRILFFWPKLVSLTCVLSNIRITHTKFNVEGLTTVFRARFTIEEARNVRLTMEEVRAVGTQRSADGSSEATDAPA